MTPEQEPIQSGTDDARSIIFIIESLLPLVSLGRLYAKAGMMPESIKTGALIALTDSARLGLFYIYSINKPSEIDPFIITTGIVAYAIIGALGANLTEKTLDRFGLS